MSIRNPLLESYTLTNKGSSSTQSATTSKGVSGTYPVTQSLLKRSPENANLLLCKSLKSRILTSSNTTSSYLNIKASPSLKISTCGKLFTQAPSVLSSSRPGIGKQFLAEKKVEKEIANTKDVVLVDDNQTAGLETPFLDTCDFIPVTTKPSIINGYFETVSKNTVILSKEEVLKQNFVNLAACSLIHVPKLDEKKDTVREELISLAEDIIEFDPEFILKTALFTRLILNIRVTANFLIAFAAFKKECRRYLKKYYDQAIVLPSDWIDVAELYTSLGDKDVGFSALPVCLRKAMIKKFPKFDVYQIGKYNKNPKKGKSTGGSDSEDEETKLFKRHHFTLKQLIRKIHISDPPDIVMPILGKKYPETQEDFYRSRLSGIWDEKRAGKRMKIPTPYTWETQLASKGNNAGTWKALILSKKLPYMAMLRNLRNIIHSGVNDSIHKIVQKKLCSPEDVKRSKQFPFRFLSAYAVLESLKGNQPDGTISWSTTPEFEQDKLLEDYKDCLDKAVQLAAINNVKPIKGAVLIMFYCGSRMDELCSTKGFGLKRSIREVAGLMTLMCMFSSEHCEIIYFNDVGSMRGENIETGGEILKFLSCFLDASKEANEKILKAESRNSCIENVLAELIEQEKHYDTVIQISDRCTHIEGFYGFYRQKVNAELLSVNINLKSHGTSVAETTFSHRNDVVLHGFSDQILQYISERGSGELLSNVESIDKKFHLLPLPKPMASGYISPLKKKVTSRVIRIFVSSTFIDLGTERKQLMNSIFPEINRIAMEQNTTIQEVDLRWGITENESQSNKVILRCLEEVSRCHYFLCIIGERYGTTFSSYPDAADPDLAWLNSESSGLSMTEIEIKHALNLIKRKKLSLKNFMVLIKSDKETEERRDSKLEKIINMIKTHPAVDDEIYMKKYGGRGNFKFHEVAKKALKDTVLENSASDITDDLSGAEMHNGYLHQKSVIFVGRPNLVLELVKAIKKGSVILVSGPVGTGKSSLCAKALTYFGDEETMNDFHHIVKLNSSSKDLVNLLYRLCFHMSKILNEELGENFDPITTFWGQIAKCETPLKIYIDGCDELIHPSDLFSWLPDKLPANITLILTASSSSQWYSYLIKKYASITNFMVPKLSSTEKVQVTKETLALYGKKIEEKGFNSQLSLLLSKKEANNPLFIDLCINQLKQNAVHENLTQCIKELPPTTEELYTKIIVCTAIEIPVCKKVLAYLLCSKNGISETDMLQFLHLKPIALVSILYYLRLFIDVDEKTGVLSLVNHFAKSVVLKLCFLECSLVDVHKSLAGHYAAICHSGSHDYLSLRKDAYQCLLFHYTQAGEWIIVEDYMTDLNFIRQMVYLELIPDLLAVFNRDPNCLKGIHKIAYKNMMEKDGMKKMYQFLINNKSILMKEPYLLKQQLLLHSRTFAESIGYSAKTLFNNYVGSFQVLKETDESNNCLTNEHHSVPVTCLAASQTCSIILIGFQDSKLLAFDVDSSKIIQTYRGHSGPVTCCGFLTSSRFISAGSDGSLRLWGLLDSVCIASIAPHSYQVKDIDINDITKCVLSAGIDRRVAVWHNDVIFETIDFDHPMNCISFIDNGKKFVAGSWSGAIFAYDLVQKVKINVKKSGKVHKCSIRSLSAGKTQFATLDITGVVSVWNQSSLGVLKSVRLNNVSTLSYDCNDMLLFGQTNGIINVASGFGHMSLLETSVDSIAVTALFKYNGVIFVGYYNGTVVEIQCPGEWRTLAQHKGRVNFITVLNIRGFDDLVASCSDDGSVHLSCLNKRKANLKEITPHLGKTLALCASKTNILFSGGTDCAITATKLTVNGSDLETQEVKLYGHQAPVSTLLLLKDGERLISGSHDGSVKLWNTSHGNCMYTSSNSHTDWVTCSAAASPLATSFVTGSNDNLVILWKLETSRILPIKKLLGHMSPVNCVSVLGTEKSDVAMVIAGAQDGSVALWNKSGSVISSCQTGRMGVNACTFDNTTTVKDATAYIGTVDGDVKIMKPSALNIVASFTHHNDAVKSLAGMSGGKVASISCDNTVQVWQWVRSTSTNAKMESIADIQYHCVGKDVYKIGVLDKSGRVANWSVNDGTLSFVSETEPPTGDVRCFALKPPSAEGDASLFVPSNEKTIRVMMNKSHRVEFFYDAYGNEEADIWDTVKGHTDKITRLGNKTGVWTHWNISNGNIFQAGDTSGMLTVVNLSTGKRITSGHLKEMRQEVLSSRFEQRYIPKEVPYPTASSYYDGNSIIGTQTGYIKVPRRRKLALIERVFNQAVTAIECVCNSKDEMVIFAGSKDGVVKVLTSELKVVGMYHTSGPVTALCVLQPSGRVRTDSGDEVFVVAGDKCGVLHFLKWNPPTMRAGEEVREEVRGDDENDDDMDCDEYADELMASFFD